METKMNETLSRLADMVLSVAPVSRVRRNHGLEHATLHILSERYPKISLAGHSDVGGFWVIGDVSTEDLRSAAEEALQRMRSGEHNLAVHPNCGTNFVTAGTLAGVAAAVAMLGAGKRTRDKVERIPLAASLATVALMFAQPMGLKIQERVTTSGDPEALSIVAVQPSRRGRIQAHRVITQG
jgi:hypothetical protein